MAPYPKPAGMRRRRNGRGDVVLPEGGRQGAIPKLPGSSELLPSTRRWWRTVWSSPVAAVWLDLDVPALARLAGLIDRVARGDVRVTVLTEIRQLEDRFGLSVASRRRLQISIEPPRPVAAAAEPSSKAADLRARLEAAPGPPGTYRPPEPDGFAPR